MYNLIYKKSKNNGAALITVLIIVFLIMAIISDITVENYRTIRKLTNQKIQAQSYSILTAALAFGRAGLSTSAITSPIDTLSDIWAQPLPKAEILPNLELSGFIIDEQSKFNINNLINNGTINDANIIQFNNLLKYLNLPQQLGYNIALYMASPIYQNDIINQYTMNIPSYRPAGRPLLDLAELILVKGMQSNYLYKLSPYITAIPVIINQNESRESFNSPTEIKNIQVNVNTASAVVIAARSGIPLNVAQNIVSMRSNQPFNNIQEIQDFLSKNGVTLSNFTNGVEKNIILENLSTSSSYFTIHVMVENGDYTFKSIAFVKRTSRDGTWPIILWQHIE